MTGFCLKGHLAVRRNGAINRSDAVIVREKVLGKILGKAGNRGVELPVNGNSAEVRAIIGKFWLKIQNTLSGTH